MEDKDKVNFLKYGFFLLFAVFGSIAKSAQDIVNSKDVTLRVFICKIIVSIFAGHLALLYCIHTGKSDEITGGIVGLSGWLGADLIHIIINKFK